MENSNTVISVKNLSKIYKLYNKHIDRLKESIHPFSKKYHRKFSALKGVSFDVQKGEVIGIIGKNGSGKSTLLNLLAGITIPSVGAVSKKGRVSALLGLDTGFNPELTGIENIYFYGTVQGFTKAEMSEKLDEIISFADIGDFISQPVKIYSSGMKARLAFSAAINIDPEILIIDEVLAVGDQLFIRKCYAKMRSFLDKNKTILLVTHALSTVNEFCTRAILLDQGEVILDGPPKLVTTQYQQLLFSKSANVKHMREEILKINQNKELQKIISEETNSTKESDTVKNKKNMIQENKPKYNRTAPFFMENFTPKSTVEYKKYDIQIFDIHIKTKERKKVNALVVNDEYIYTFKVRFNMDIKNVIFGSRFKTQRGIPISGLNSYDEKNELYTAHKGDLYLIEYFFKCNLLPGTYFTDTGLGQIVENELIFLNRLVDALVFKVQDDPSIGYKGIVHLYQRIQVNKIE